MTTAILIPLEPYLPTIAGFTTPYIMFAFLAGYIVLNRPRALARTWFHPVFLAAFGLLTIACLIESAHPLSRYTDIFRMGLVIMAAIFVASLCRDREALRASINGYLIGGVLASILLFFTGYGALQQTTATDFSEASQIRSKVYTDIIQGNLNGWAYLAAQGAVVALALGLTARSPWRRYLFLGVTLFCVISVFLTMSRGGIVIVGVSCATVMFAYGVRRVRVILIAAVLVVGALIWIPGAVFSRLSFSLETGSSGRMEARASIYKAAIDHLPEYVLTGVGAGNFWGPWGLQSGFYKDYRHGLGVVMGAHNAFIQVTVQWGVAGLLGLMLLIYLTYRCLPKGGGKDVLALCLYGLAVSLLLKMMVAHTLVSKDYPLGLGVLVGGGLWIWPKRIVPPLRRGQSRRHLALEHVS